MKNKLKSIKSKSIFKRVWFYVAVFVLIIIGIFSYINYNLGMHDPDAVLYPEGRVDVTRLGRVMSVSEEFTVKQDDVISTLDSKAKVFMYNSIFVNLEKQTVVSLEQLQRKHVKIKQDKGSSWNKVSNIYGKKEFEVITPKSVASVRGTEFLIDTNTFSSTALVAEGIVSMKSKSSSNSLDVSRLEKGSDNNGSLSKLYATKKDIDFCLEKMNETLTILKKERQRQTISFLKRNPFIARYIESNYGFKADEMGIKEFFISVDSENSNVTKLAEEYNEIPLINKEFINYLDEITREIKREQWLISGYVVKR